MRNMENQEKYVHDLIYLNCISNRNVACIQVDKQYR